MKNKIFICRLWLHFNEKEKIAHLLYYTYLIQLCLWNFTYFTNYYTRYDIMQMMYAFFFKKKEIDNEVNQKFYGNMS